MRKKIIKQTFLSSRNSRDNNDILCKMCDCKFSETVSLCPARSPISLSTFLNAVNDENLKKKNKKMINNRLKNIILNIILNF